MGLGLCCAKAVIQRQETTRSREEKHAGSPDLKLILLAVVRPDLVGGKAEGDQVEEGGDPAVEGRLLVASPQPNCPLTGAPVCSKTRQSQTHDWRGKTCHVVSTRR